MDRDKIKQAILETVQEVKEAPSGVMYAALVGVVTFSEYVEIVDELVREGHVRQDGHLLLALVPGDGMVGVMRVE